MAAASAKNKARKREWLNIGAQCVEFTPGQPEVVVLPQAWWEAGRLDNQRFMYRTVAHESTHLAQYAASQGQVWADMDTYFPQLRGTAGRDYGFLVEGHAYWADREVTTKILGEPEPTTGLTPRAGSLRYRAVAEAQQTKEAVAFVERARDNTGKIINAYGIDAFNRVWTSRDLVPTSEETDDAIAIWQARFGSL
ncbi:hypothetical protein [Streptomyces sp. NBC_00140]|uniref:hypothetical protein n=1 Tax=Streptomyces sp. NBC_00140 TaxID=2975664 RepID=UPI00225BEEE2|nr:hypothetical protein [Streptomyces sp. NBC_00140]MCX5328143.1 hypothetical protein [Streptomyces sp. NBC_00140]